MYLEEIADIITALPARITPADPDDLPFLDVASTANADFLVTGNTGHFPPKIGEAQVVTPAAFVGHYLRQ